MQNRGFEEEQAAYAVDDPQTLIGQCRRFGSAGPAYEIVNINPDGSVQVEVIYSGEKVTCSLAEILEDPLAETFP